MWTVAFQAAVGYGLVDYGTGKGGAIMAPETLVIASDPAKRLEFRRMRIVAIQTP